MEKIKKILNALIWIFFFLFISVVILTQTPSVQSFIGKKIGKVISERIGAQVNIGRVNLGFFNRLIIDNVIIYDKLHVKMLKAGRISAKFDILDFTKGQITITSAQFFTLKTHFYKLSSTEKPNYQFIIDSLGSNKTGENSPIDLSVKSLVIRNGNFVYDENYIKQTKQFSLSHINISKLSTRIMLNKLKDDSINIFVQKLSCIEHSGLSVNDMTFAFLANTNRAVIHNFLLKSKHSILQLPHLIISYKSDNNGVNLNSIRYNGKILGTIIPSDFSSFLLKIEDLRKPITFKMAFSGTDKSFNLNNIRVKLGNLDKIEGWGNIHNWSSTPYWKISITDSNIGSDNIKYYLTRFLPHQCLPEFVNSLGNVLISSKIKGNANEISLVGKVKTELGSIDIKGRKSQKHYSGVLSTNELNVGIISGQRQFGKLNSKLNFEGRQINGKLTFSTANFYISNLDFKGYRYNNIHINYNSDNQLHKADINIIDPNISLKAGVKFEKLTIPNLSLAAKVRSLNLYNLNLSRNMQGASIEAQIDANIKGNDLNNSIGTISVANLRIKGGNKDYNLSRLFIDVSQDNNNNNNLSIDGDFGQVNIKGCYNYATLAQSLTNIIGHRLPTLPGLPKIYYVINNDFQITANITKADWLRVIWGIPLQLNRPLKLEGKIRDNKRQIELTLNLPSFIYGTNSYEQGYIRFTSPNDALEAFGHLQQVGNKTKGTYWNISAKADNDELYTSLSFENNGKSNFAGIINTKTNFLNNKYGLASADITVLPSDIIVGDSIWHVRPANINYYKNHLTVNHLSLVHNRQYIVVNGNATPNPSDTLCIDLHDVDISYILNLVNFHSVEFAGKATGKAQITSMFNKPDMQGDFWVQDFKFEDGRMGILTANISLNHLSKHLDIDATAYDDDNSRTFIKGYVSPMSNYIDLRIKALNTRGEFLESFCSSFMNNANLKVNGNVRIYGDLNKINLEGEALVDGAVRIKPLNTTYMLQACPVKMIPNEIQMSNCNIIDRNGNQGFVNGSIYHQNLTKMSCDINVNANNLLAYDFKDYSDQSFVGTVYATGDFRIKGKNGDVVIDAHATPQKGSFIEYNASSPATTNNQSFIHWHNQDSIEKASPPKEINDYETLNEIDIPSDIHLNLHINCTPDATLRVLMDKQSGDYIALHGKGGIRATYFNKGDFDMFGTYEVTGGTYKLTVQNVLRRDFQFLSGGTIGFGGNPMDAILKLKAQYTVNGVSLSDLNIGKSFTSNNIRVNCLMNITGTPLMPKVDFGLDLPTINNDAKQMITQLINSQEGMNQQVLYLLTIGRFYSQNSNSNSSLITQQQNRTSLAMQSILSGTLSQQLNTILNSVTKNDNWSFGANISTGDEGWNNAEYEGLLSGRMFNNRLLFNGQFGYRDKANATTSFIGDFDLQYLIYPNGNLAVRVYNQTNDRYFTKNSLNTQGIGIVLKKDFKGWRDLFGIKSQKRKTKKISNKNKNAKSKNKSRR